MTGERPNPDELLARVKADDAKALRGKLKIFFGYAAGVGKTFAMLETAQREKATGRDVVVGYVEPHNRPETVALLTGLETVPTRSMDYRGVALREFDVDAALKRRPELILVDELAHTNVAGSRHAKRWQDVEELREAGITVWTTLNVQHIESLNDVIGQITGVVVGETIPDSVFDSADDIELVDISIEELLLRLKAGKVYVPEQARRAIQHFFQKSNLAALRELSFRQAAQRMHADVEAARRARSAPQPWATAERLLACVGPSPTTSRVIRTAKRMAMALDAPWIAVAVEQAGMAGNVPVHEQLAEHFRLAERLGAETATLSGQNVAATLIDFARARNVTKILIGKTDQTRWRRLWFGSVVDDIIDRSGDIDVYVIHGAKELEESASRRKKSPPVVWGSYIASAAIVAASALIAEGARRFNLAAAEANTVMLFLAAVAFIAFRFGRGPAIGSSILAVFVFDFFFVRPVFTFAVHDTQYLFTFAVMLAIGIGISTLTSRLKAQIESTRLREHHASALYQLGKQLSSLSGSMFLVAAAGQQVADLVGGEVAIYLKPEHGLPVLEFGMQTEIARHPISLPAAEWVIDHDQIAGAGTNTLPNAIGLFFPLIGSQQTVGAIAVKVTEMNRLLDPNQRRMLEACAGQLALALERDQMAIEAAEARVQVEAEQVRSALLSSVSHDLKTPLASIAGASSSLLESRSLDIDTRRQFLETISEESVRLNRLLENILQMSKLDSGGSPPNRQWHVLEEIVGSALHRTEAQLAKHVVAVRSLRELPLIYVDGILLEQVFVNLLENASQYTPAGTTITISAMAEPRSIVVSVSDTGPGLVPGTEQKIFEKFYRSSPTADAGPGSGLGLAICRAIVKAHGGTMTAANNPGVGAEFVIRLPQVQGAPQIAMET